MRRRFTTLALLAVLAATAGCGGDGAGAPVAALSPPESSWVPGQPTLGANPAFATVFDRGKDLAERRLHRRELALERIEREKLAAKKRDQAEARRRYLEAKRRAERAYRLALKRAAARRRAQEERIARIKRRIARLRREREEKLKVPPGEECKLPNVRRRYNCRTGRLPDPATDGKKGQK